MSNKEVNITSNYSIVYSTYFDRYVETLDSSQQQYICNAFDIYNIGAAEHYIHCIPPKNLAINFISNFSLLFPILYETKNDKKKVMDDLKKLVPEFFYMCDENGDFLKSKTGRMKIDDIIPLKNFRDALEHGSYKIVFNQNEKDYYIKYEFVHKGQRYYKKISLKTLFKFFSYFVDNYLDYNNRLALGCINNMKLIKVLMDRFTDNFTLKDEYKYSVDSELLDYNLLVSDVNKNHIIDDMKAASICALFYISFQKNLENLIGPNFISLKSNYITDIDIVKAVVIGKHIDMNSFDFLDDFGGLSTVYEEKLPVQNMLKRTIASYNKWSDKYSAGEISRELLQERTQNIVDISQRFLNHIRKLEIIHHIRNSFAHGKTIVGNGKIVLCDYNPKTHRKTYQNIISVEKMKKIVDKINISIVQKHLIQMESRIVSDCSYKKAA